jgi:2-hydroxychromene-2-carboxylate isomerase
MPRMPTEAVLYFDVGSPYSYLAVERVAHVLGYEPAFQPVLLGALFALRGHGSWAAADPARRAAGMLEVQSRAATYGLPPVRWPRRWPGDYLTAMRIATWAQREGAAREYARAAGRRAFVLGRDLSRLEEAAAAAGDAGLDPAEAVLAAGEPAIKAALRAATDEAHRRGVHGVPTLSLGGELLWGDDRLEEAVVLAAPA